MAGETILIIEDGAETRQFVVEYVLLPNGYKVLEARDGKEGLDIALEKRPDLILLDLQMPRMNGIQVLEELAAHDMDIPVILVTFHGSEEIAIEVYRMGVRDYIKKPFTVEEILSSIERSLTEVRLRRERESLTSRLIDANRALQKRVQELNVLYSVGVSVNALLDMNSLLPRIADAAVMLSSAHESSIYLLNDKGLLTCRAIKTRTKERAEAANSEVADDYARSAIKNKKPSDVEIKQISGRESAYKAYIPIIFDNVVTGVLVVNRYARTNQRFSKHDTALLMMLANYAGIAIAHATKYRTHIETSVEPDEFSLAEATWSKSIFVSYSRTDWDDYVKPIVDRLRKEKFTVWIDQQRLQGGEDWLDTIGEALDRCQYMVLCVSPTALLSEYVKIEYRYFIDEKKPIIPVMCQEARLPPELRRIQHVPHNQLDILITRLRRFITTTK